MRTNKFQKGRKYVSNWRSEKHGMYYYFGGIWLLSTLRTAGTHSLAKLCKQRTAKWQLTNRTMTSKTQNRRRLFEGKKMVVNPSDGSSHEGTGDDYWRERRRWLFKGKKEMAIWGHEDGYQSVRWIVPWKKIVKNKHPWWEISWTPYAQLMSVTVLAHGLAC